MKFAFYFSARAESELQSTINFLDKEWGESTADKFLDKVDELLNLISESPEMFVCVNRKRKIHKCVINANVILFYRIHKNEIEVITFFQSHQHPLKF